MKTSMRSRRPLFAPSARYLLDAKTSILEKVTWTVPTLVGKSLYVRDKKTIMALDLG